MATLNPLRLDPTRTATLRRRFETEVRKRLQRLKKAIRRLIVEQDAFGLLAGTVGSRIALNTQWQFLTDEQKLEAFKVWLVTQLSETVLSLDSVTGDPWTAALVQESYRRGLSRAFTDVRQENISDFYAGTKAEFLRESFQRPVSANRVKLLAARTFTDLQGISQEIDTKLSRILVDGFIQGQNPREIARTIDNEIDSIGRRRALTLARTEVIRAHAEGQLDGLETLGVEEVGVAVEWATAEDPLVCPLCRPLHGIVLTIEEAHGMIPRHPNCRCAWIPANVGEEDEKQQKKTKARIQKAIEDSLKAEIPKRSKRSVATQRKRSSWQGSTKRISKKRPKSIL